MNPDERVHNFCQIFIATHMKWPSSFLIGWSIDHLTSGPTINEMTCQKATVDWTRDGPRRANESWAFSVAQSGVKNDISPTRVWMTWRKVQNTNTTHSPLAIRQVTLAGAGAGDRPISAGPTSCLTSVSALCNVAFFGPGKVEGKI